MFKRQPPAVPRLDQCAGLAALIIGRFAAGLNESAFAMSNFSLPRLNVLMSLNENGDQTTAEIAKTLHSDLSTINRALKRLLEDGVVEPGDLRRGRKTYRLTEKGRRRLRACLSTWRSTQQEMKRVIGEDGIRALHALAESITKHSPRKIRWSLHPAYPFRLNEDRY